MTETKQVSGDGLLVKVPGALMGQILAYLRTRPWVEVNHLMAAVQGLPCEEVKAEKPAPIVAHPATPRNAPCPCGSGRKAKNCNCDLQIRGARRSNRTADPSSAAAPCNEESSEGKAG